MSEAIAWCSPDLSGNEATYAADAVTSGQIGPTGPYLDRLETMLTAATGARHVVPTSSGTDALHMALVASGVGPGDEVIVPAWTFVATANAVRHAGAHPVVLDVDPLTWQLDPAQVTRWLDTACTP